MERTESSPALCPFFLPSSFVLLSNDFWVETQGGGAKREREREKRKRGKSDQIDALMWTIKRKFPQTSLRDRKREDFLREKRKKMHRVWPVKSLEEGDP